MLVAVSSPLTRIIPGLMIWTIIFFLIVFFVLRKYAFSAIQNLIDQRREAIRRSIEAADEARDEAQRLLEEHRKLINDARGQAESILAEARKTRESMEQRMREETESERQRRLEETKAILKQIEDAAGRKVEATQKVDPDIVGGIVLQAGSLRVDASVRGRLERLRNELVRS